MRILLLIALVWWITFAACLPQEVETHPTFISGIGIRGDFCAVTFQGGVSGEWLTVERTNTKAHDQRLYDPSYVTVVSDYRPIAKKRADGKWEIEFFSDVAR